MDSVLINVTYLGASILFILGIKGLTHPRTAVRGNLLGASGMLLAVVATLADRQVLGTGTQGLGLILVGILLGSAIGATLALKIQMTAMPQMVALLNAFGGAASALIAGAVLAVEELVRTIPPNHEGTARSMADAGQRWLLERTRPVVRHVGPFHTINGYGLFRSMTTQRPEIVVEGSHDGTTWSAYEFRWKPGDPAGRPGFVAPHMPRLDWQMWFAALNPSRAQHWLEGLMRGLLRGSPDVLALLDTDPFDGEPPSYVRLMYYQYRFASPEERRDRGHWWVRELSGRLTPAVSLEALERR